MIPTRMSGVIPMIGGYHQQIIVIHGIDNIAECRVKFFKRFAISKRIPSMSELRIEIHQICKQYPLEILV